MSTSAAVHQSDGAPSGEPVAIAQAPRERENTRAPVPVQRVADPLLDALAAMSELLGLAKMLVVTGFMPRAVNTPEKCLAIMLTGREMGIGPMLAVRAINIIDGKPVVSADLQLARFKAEGGRAVFQRLDERAATLALRHPNGDEHVETFTHEMAAAAGLLTKDNWTKHKVAMLRSRVITAALKSIGYEATAGVYDPDEADHWAPGASAAIARGDDPNVIGHVEQATTGRVAAGATAQPLRDGVASRYVSRWPTGDLKGHALDEFNETVGSYAITDLELEAMGRHAATKLKNGHAKDPEIVRQLGADVLAEIERRERANAASEGPNSPSAAT